MVMYMHLAVTTIHPPPIKVIKIITRAYRLLSLGVHKHVVVTIDNLPNGIHFIQCYINLQ